MFYEILWCEWYWIEPNGKVTLVQNLWILVWRLNFFRNLICSTCPLAWPREKKICGTGKYFSHQAFWIALRYCSAWLRQLQLATLSCFLIDSEEWGLLHSCGFFFFLFLFGVSWTLEALILFPKLNRNPNLELLLKWLMSICRKGFSVSLNCSKPCLDVWEENSFQENVSILLTS